MPEALPEDGPQMNFASAAAAVQGVTAGRPPPHINGTPEVTPPPTPNTTPKFPGSMHGQAMQEAVLQQMGQMGHITPGMLAQAQAMLAMQQMWQQVQASQALLMQGTSPEGMQDSLPGGMPGNSAPGALFGGLQAFQPPPAAGVAQSGPFPGDAYAPDSSDVGIGASGNTGHLNSLAQEHKAAAVSQHASSDTKLDLDAPEFTPVVQSVHEPALIAPSSLRSIKSSSSICSLGGQLDTVAEDETHDQMLGSSWDGYPSYTNGLIVKNTFLQEAVEQSPSGMRLIASAAGRLDCLAGEGTPTPTAAGETFVRSRDNTPRANEETPSPDSTGRGQSGAFSRSNLHASGVQVTVKNTFLDFDSAQKQRSGLQPSSSWGGRLDVLAEECSKGEDVGLYRVPEGNHLFARQVSPNSGMPASALARPASPGDALRSPEKRLQDTPFAAEPGSRLRSVGSGAGSLSALAEEKEELHDADVSVMQCSEDYLRDEAPLQSSGFGAGASNALNDPRLQASAMPGNVPLADMQWKVKNTFLDFEPSEPKGLGLRAVHTAAGRLDLMG